MEKNLKNFCISKSQNNFRDLEKKRKETNNQPGLFMMVQKQKRGQCLDSCGVKSFNSFSFNARQPLPPGVLAKSKLCGYQMPLQKARILEKISR
jgi:hypothetical protein